MCGDVNAFFSEIDVGDGEETVMLQAAELEIMIADKSLRRRGLVGVGCTPVAHLRNEGAALLQRRRRCHRWDSRRDAAATDGGRRQARAKHDAATRQKVCQKTPTVLVRRNAIMNSSDEKAC